MQEFLDAFRKLDRNEISYEKLGEFVRNSGVFELDLESRMPEEPEPGKYSRNKILNDPLEITIVRWPVGGESAIHFHEGFYGYVAVCEGIIENAVFEHSDGTLRKTSGDLFTRGAMIPEPDRVIHLIRSIGQDPAITIHFYFPPLDSFSGMKLYDFENRRIGVLNGMAKAASWKEPEECFESIDENAFVPEKEMNSAFGFHMVHLYPKPDVTKVQQLIGEYYSEIAEHYDRFDQEQKARSEFIKSINRLVASKIQKSGKGDTKVLSIGCGTGRRDLEIQGSSTVPYKIFGVELSEKMCQEARRRGIETYNGPWMQAEFSKNEFDLIYFLYGFGHLSERQQRLDFLKKVKSNLKKGGKFIFDVFNQDDTHEWGPRALKNFEAHHLEDYGYDRGDVFYKKVGQSIPAFLHYFSEESLRHLLKEAGFTKVEIDYVGYRFKPGELVERDEGVMLATASI